ncbi:GerAB/ArcD/ProY family transporter [Fictibacillus fluitans]|uniref:GerAB/ArcD/ProY family transporter n=1 Tax=Fictibacillus fluitans TaxID=3058422 RepID=UPI0033BE883C
MKTSDSITFFQLSLIAITCIGLKCHVFLIQPTVKTASVDAWLSIIITFGLTLVWLPLILYINKKTNGEHLFQWMRSAPVKGLQTLF